MHKGDASPLTQADLAAEACILKGLAGAFPAIPVVSEEAASNGDVPSVRDRFFLVDPLDGTKEFVKGDPQFTVNIALIDDQVPVAGVVYAPALGSLFYGDIEGGAFTLTVKDGVPGPRATLRVAPVHEEPLRVVASRSHGQDACKELMKGLPVKGETKAGSSLKFCLIACGDADIYPRSGPTMQWDTAAGDAVLRAAGGVVLDRDGEALRYGAMGSGQTPDGGASAFRNPMFVAVGCPNIVSKLRAAAS